MKIRIKKRALKNFSFALFSIFGLFSLILGISVTSQFVIGGKEKQGHVVILAVSVV